MVGGEPQQTRAVNLFVLHDRGSRVAHICADDFAVVDQHDDASAPTEPAVDRLEAHESLVDLKTDVLKSVHVLFV